MPNQLMLHCGAEAITRAELANVLPTGKRGRFHNPIPYIDTIDMVTDALNHYGYTIESESFGALKDGNRFFGVMELRPTVEPEPLEGELIRAKDHNTMLALRGSYDSSLPRAVGLGSRVFVCDNLCFSAEIKVSAKQTLNATKRLQSLIHNAMGQIAQVEDIQQQQFDAYKNAQLTHEQGDALIVELLRQEVINSKNIQKVVQEWDKPSHVEHEQYGRTAWLMHNAVTEAMKPTNGRPSQLLINPNKGMGLSAVLDSTIGFKPTLH